MGKRFFETVGVLLACYAQAFIGLSVLMSVVGSFIFAGVWTPFGSMGGRMALAWLSLGSVPLLSLAWSQRL